MVIFQYKIFLTIVATASLLIILEMNFLDGISPLLKKQKNVELLRKSKNFEVEYIETNADICANTGDDLKLLIIVTSKPSNGRLRLAIRETWGSFAHNRYMEVAFLLGYTFNSSLEHSLQAEQNIYSDLIRADFNDTYGNLTLKTITMLDWITHYCGNAKFLLKTDDDVFVNIFKLTALISIIPEEENYMFGFLLSGNEPFRNISSKYYISSEEYPFNIFPDFLSGASYLLPVHITRKLLLHAQSRPLFRFEDVFLSGFVARELNIKLRHSTMFWNQQIPTKSYCILTSFISVHYVEIAEQYELWRILRYEKQNCI